MSAVKASIAGREAAKAFFVTELKLGFEECHSPFIPQNVAGFTPMRRWYDLARFRDVWVHCSVPICFDTVIIIHLYDFIDFYPIFLKQHTCLVHLSVCISRQYPMLMIPASLF
jgi:hypothetical protein